MPHAYARLRAAMAPDPSRWYYTGKCNDAGEYGASSCACGHEIRYEFVIACEDDDRTLIIGSTCIEKNIPSLIEDGAERLASQLDEARHELKRHLTSQRRDLEAEEALPELHADYRRLRNWCFIRRDEWKRERPNRRLPKVLNWIEKVPMNNGSPSRDAIAIRKGYVTMWLNAAQAASTYREPPLEPIPAPSQPRLLVQLTKAIERALSNKGHRNHAGAVLAVETCAALHELRRPTSEPTTMAAHSTLSEPPAPPSAAEAEISPAPDGEIESEQSVETEEAVPLDQAIYAEILSAVSQIWGDREPRKRHYPPWSEGADRELPFEMTTDGDEVLAKLRAVETPNGSNRELADALEQQGVVERVRAADVVDDDEVCGIAIYLPFYESQRIVPVGDAEISWQDRWQEVARILSILAALAFDWATLGFEYDGEMYSYTWDEYRRCYDDPPEYIAIPLRDD